jgi:hypothetical protein
MKPYCIQLLLKNEEEVYKLSKINFGMTHDEVNLYSVCNKNGCAKAYGKKVNIVSILPVRWNAKYFANRKKSHEDMELLQK